MPGMVYILLVNWNGWQDTIECLESVFRLDYPDFRVIVCDNGSTDGSLETIRAWAAGRLETAVAPENPLYRFSHPPVAKPVDVACYSRAAAENGGKSGEKSRLVLIDTGGNLGFAGGNNVGMRYALARGDFDFIWLLNNDTVVEPAALARLVERMAARPAAGICGSLLPYYDAPELIWTAGGGSFNRWLAKSCSLDDRKPVALATSQEEIERSMSYVAGAAMLVRKSFLLDVGLMCEDYFLYFEEPDWCFRGRGRYSLAYAGKSVVYHKVGISTTKHDAMASAASLEYYFRAQLKFTAKFFPGALPLVWLRVQLNRLKNTVRTAMAGQGDPQ